MYDLVVYTCIDSEPLSRRFHNIYKTASLAVTFGKWPQRVLLESAGVHSEVIPHGVDIDTFKFDMNKRLRFRAELQAEPSHILLGTVARNQPRKNLPTMLVVLHALRYGRYIVCEDCGRVTMDVVNPCNRKVRIEVTQCKWCQGRKVKRAGPDNSWLWYYHGAMLDIKGWDMAELINRYGLRDCVRTNPFLHPLVGNMDHDLAGIYSAMDVFVLPTTCEGFGMPISEAMSCERPVVAPGYSAYMDWAPSGGLMVDYVEYVDHGVHANRAMGLPESWIEHLLTLKNPVVRDELGRAGRKKMEEYAWPGIVKSWEKLLDSVLSHRGGDNWRRGTRI
jgi:glycosyltransferase involved in cell wall biosynthesis